MKPMLITHVLAAALIVCGGCAQSQTASSESEGPYATAAAGTPLEQMKLAEVSGKISVPVEVRYVLSGQPVRDQPMGLEFAVAPRIYGQNLKIEFPESSSVSLMMSPAPITQQKADPTQVIRRKVLITPLTDGDGEIRILVSMDAQGGRFFGVFSIPVRR